MSVTTGSISAALLGELGTCYGLQSHGVLVTHPLAPHPSLTSYPPSFLCRPGVSGHAHHHWSTEFTNRAIAVRVMALVMMAISIGMACYAAYNFKKRGDMLV